MKPNLLGSAIVAALCSSASLQALAQEQAKEETKTLERIEVTGTRIRQVNKETAQPVQIVTRAEIEKTGLNNVFDVLNNLTASDGTGLSTVTTQTNGSNGDQQISLRGFGANRTLVLVDGKRWITDIAGVVDVGSIPLAIIERIEVLKDGASAIYGSDAIGGVINVVTRKNYDGAQAGVYYGQTSKGDGGQKSADLTIGSEGERSSSIFSISYKSQDSIFAGDRERSAYPFLGCADVLTDPTNASGLGAYCGSASGAYGRFNVPGLGNVALNHVSTSPLTGGNPLADGVITAADYHTFNNLDRYNFAPVNYLQQPNEVLNVFTTGRFDLTDNISLYGRVSYTKRTSTQQLAQVPTTIANNGASGPPWIMNASAAGIFNPFGQQINTINFRNVAIGPRVNHFDFDIFGAQLGAEGSFELGDHTLNWDVYGQYNDGQYDQTGENYVNLFNLRNSIGPSGYDATPGRGFYCGTSWATRIQGCMPFNIFGGPTLGLGANYAGHVITEADVAAMTDYVAYTLVQTSGNTSRQFGANLTGDLFELPGGPLGFAIGVEHRSDDSFNQPDALVSEGGSSTNFSLPTNGGTKVTEYYAEFLLPLLKDVFLAKELELDIAVRKSNYTASGLADPNPADGDIATQQFNIDQGSPTTWKTSLKYKPVDDLLVRASWGQTFRAPSSVDLFGGTAEGFPAALDPCRTGNWANLNAAGQANCIAGGVPVGGATQPFGQIRILAGSNVNLTPETGENFGLGFVYSPRWADGLDVSMDLWRINLKNLIFTYGANGIMNNCYAINFPSGQTGNPFFCQFVTRDLAAGAAVTLINTAPINVASASTQGIDLGIGYKLQTGIGDFRFKLDTTWTDKFLFNNNVDPVTGQTIENPDFVGTYGGGPTFEYRSTLTVGWSKGDFSAQWTTRYLSDLAENTCFFQQASPNTGFVCNNRPGDDANQDGINDGPADFLNHSGAYAVHDLQFAWKAPWGGSVSVGGRNIFGKDPPVLYNSFAHSFDASYDLPGGAYWYASYRQDF